MTKVCCRCKQEKLVVKFHKNKQQKDGLHVYCADCHNWLQKNLWPRDKKRVKEYKKKYMKSGGIGEKSARDWQYRHKYNITLADYDNLFAQQDGLCAICGKHQDELPRRLSVEHCHSSNQIRGLTCQNCNNKIAWYEQYKDKIDNHLGVCKWPV